MRKYHEIFGRLGNSMFQGAYIYAQMRRGLIPDIFMQGESYFGEFKDEIRKIYSDNIYNIGRGVDERVAIHVRRGD